MDTNTNWQPGWYHLSSDPDEVQRYFDGSNWTDHTSEAVAADPGSATRVEASVAPAGLEAAGAATRHWSTVPAKEAMIILAAAVLVVVLAAGGLALWQVHGRATNLTSADAVHALPSAAQVSSATGLTFGSPERSAEVGPDLAEFDDDGCNVGTNGAAPPTPVGYETGTFTAGAAAVIDGVAVFDTAEHAQQFADYVHTVIAHNQDCVVSGGSFRPEDAKINVDDHSIVAASSSQGIGVAYETSGNALVVVALADRSAPVTQDQVDQLLSVSIDAARNPDPTRV